MNKTSPAGTSGLARKSGVCEISCSLRSQIYALKSFQDDWIQVNNRQTFTDRHLLIPIN